jgi:hypothetical protein
VIGFATEESVADSAASFWDPLAATPLSMFLRESTWSYPALEVVHIVGIALVFGSILSFDLRVLGFHKSLPLDTLGRHLIPWVWTGFALNALSGVLMFFSNPVEFAVNPALPAKLALIGVAGINAVYFQRRIAPTMPEWNTDAPAPLPARTSALLSITLWLAVIVAGRMMAYVV